MITCDTLLCFSMICSSTIVVFASNKGPINYLKVLVNNKKTEKPVQILPITRVVSVKPAITTSDLGISTRMTFRDVYLHGTTDIPRSSTIDYGSSNHATENCDKRIVGCDKTVTRHSEENELVQRICSDIMSAVYRKISELTTVAVASVPTASGTTASNTTASGTTAHQKSDQQKQKKRRRHSFRKVSLRPVSHDENKETSSVAIEPDDRYHDSIFARETSRANYLTSVGEIEEENDNRWDEDADQPPKESNVVDEHVIFKSVKSQVQRSEAFPTTVVNNDDEDDDDDDDQTS